MNDSISMIPPTARPILATVDHFNVSNSGEPVYTFPPNYYHNNAVTYVDQGNYYVLFKPDYSPGYAQTGMLSSCNIKITGNHHLSLDLGFDAVGKLFSIQGTIFDDNAPSNSDDYEYPSSGIITYDKFGNIIIVPTGSSSAELVYDFGNDTLGTGSSAESETLTYGAYYQDSCNTLLKAYEY